MLVLLVLGAVLLFALLYGPNIWVKRVMARHAGGRDDFPGTGGELARHLLDEARLPEVKVEQSAEGDHYSPKDKAVRLTAANFDGKSITAVAVAAHEVGHALQDRDGYRPLALRTRMTAVAISIERIGSVVLLASPLIFGLIRSPAALFGEIGVGLAILSSSVVMHALTLPTEFDASFRRALPMLKAYLPEDDIPAARQVLKAAAFTYVAAALVSLLDFARWLRLLRL